MVLVDHTTSVAPVSHVVHWFVWQRANLHVIDRVSFCQTTSSQVAVFVFNSVYCLQSIQTIPLIRSTSTCEANAQFGCTVNIRDSERVETRLYSSNYTNADMSDAWAWQNQLSCHPKIIIWYHRSPSHTQGHRERKIATFLWFLTNI